MSNLILDDFDFKNSPTVPCGRTHSNLEGNLSCFTWRNEVECVLVPRQLIFQVLRITSVFICVSTPVTQNGPGDLDCHCQWTLGSGLPSLPEPATSVTFGRQGFDLQTFSASVYSVPVLIVAGFLALYQRPTLAWLPGPLDSRPAVPTTLASGRNCAEPSSFLLPQLSVGSSPSYL